ncbi:Preprotein translocase subunit SecY [Photobacterium sp. 1_MG-2023]|uniref:Preprotein translocase subunit SecY n=1 Tax=Photobacterium sp. 1_MG-2023 TaxID=3062646 RepID=UPI0026E13B2A|nr:Preprotein translocase subunit SecY [Photobacterium sp. 1_MG-2023]MDO6708703.1 Preprotein translocase subunit SecY [Photobacterium sp. 1_MG-2023]
MPTSNTVRFPKGRFAMWTVYSFTGASILASIIFSLLLFLSIDENPVMQVLFGGLAVIFELGKFFAWYEFGERRARRSYTGAASAFAFYSVLAAISIGGSVGGIQSATNQAQSHVSVQQSKINAYNLQIEAIEKQIELNNVAAEKYIQMARIATGVSRIQRENSKLREQQQALAMERDSLPVVNQGSVLGLIDGLAKTMKVSQEAAQLGLVIFLSVLLDFFAAFFVGLIGEELRFRQQFNQRHGVYLSEKTIRKPVPFSGEPDPEEPASASTTDAAEDYAALAIEASRQSADSAAEATTVSAYDRIVEALATNAVSCSKRAIIRSLKLTADEVDEVFTQMMNEGLVSKKPNHHFQWHGKPATSGA